jgi:hypothetical protein
MAADDGKRKGTMTQPTRMDYATSPERRRLRSLSILAIIVALIATGSCVGLTFADLWSIPAGTSVVAMGLAFNVFLIAIAAFAIGVTLAIIAVLVGGRDRLSILFAIIAGMLSLAPAPASKVTADWIAARHSWVWGG